MADIVTLYSEDVPAFIRRAGGGRAVSTVNVGHRFGWDAREAYARLIRLEREGRVRRDGMGRMDHCAAQHWVATPG